MPSFVPLIIITLCLKVVCLMLHRELIESIEDVVDKYCVFRPCETEPKNSALQLGFQVSTNRRSIYQINTDTHQNQRKQQCACNRLVE